ncbi:rhodanese-like domain-containing protein [Stomatobaculum longum]
MKKRRYLLAVVAALALPLLVSCGKKAESKETSKATESAVSMAAAETSSSASTSATGESKEEQETMGYQTIDQDTAREMMKQDDGHIILDVRTKEEYDSGHIPGAVLLPNEEINGTRPEILKDLDQPIFIYCRSGHRAGLAAEKLSKLGYRKVYNFGGVMTWTGELVK